MRLVVLGTNDAARLAPIARVSWMLTGHASATTSATSSPARAGMGGSTPDEPIAVITFFLGAMAMKKSMR